VKEAFDHLTFDHDRDDYLRVGRIEIVDGTRYRDGEVSARLRPAISVARAIAAAVAAPVSGSVTAPIARTVTRAIAAAVTAPVTRTIAVVITGTACKRARGEQPRDGEVLSS
jgi:hypothetical protein